MPFVTGLIAHGDGWVHEVSLTLDSADETIVAIRTLQDACLGVAWSATPTTLDAPADDRDDLQGELFAKYIVGIEMKDGELTEQGFVIRVQWVSWATVIALATAGTPDVEQLMSLDEPDDTAQRADLLSRANAGLAALPDTAARPRLAPEVLLAAGVSNKYGQVHVERIGQTGFDDPAEPVALLRAQDEHALPVLAAYLLRLREDPAVPVAQVESVTRQVMAFARWRAANPGGVRTPGAPARC